MYKIEIQVKEKQHSLQRSRWWLGFRGEPKAVSSAEPSQMPRLAPSLVPSRAYIIIIIIIIIIIKIEH